MTPDDVLALRAQFPAFGRVVNGLPLVYLDSASTTQKPEVVIAAVTKAMREAANIHRAVHALGVENTEAYEATRGRAARFLGAKSANEIIFTRGTTEAINLVVQSWGRANVKAGDEIVVSELEHHSNLVPWQMLAKEKGAVLCMLPIDERGEIRMSLLDSVLSQRTKIVAVAHVSNSLGTVVPVQEIARRARAVGAITVVDGAQAVAHRPVDVEALGCDFYAFSGHKLYGPTGAGVLWGRRAILDAMPPWQGGSDMIETVTFAETTFAEVPRRFETGTPDIAAVIGLGAAIDWITQVGLERIAARESELLARLTARVSEIPDVRIVGTAREKVGVLSFNLGDLHPHDVGTALDLEGIAVRTGHHCTQPVMDHFGVDATVRASLGIYSTDDDIDRLVAGLRKVKTVLG